MEAFLNVVLPPVFEGRGTFEVFNFGDKRTLLSEMPGRLKAYARWMPPDWRIVILIDEDRQDCEGLKARLEEACKAAGLDTKSTNPSDFRVLNRIVVEELEAWILGDPDAVQAAFPRVSSSIGTKARYRNPDAIRGGTWEALERELQSGGYFKAGIAKGQVAAVVGAHIVPPKESVAQFPSVLGRSSRNGRDKLGGRKAKAILGPEYKTVETEKTEGLRPRLYRGEKFPNWVIDVTLVCVGFAALAFSH